MDKTLEIVFASMCACCRKRIFYPNENLTTFNATTPTTGDSEGCGVCFGILSQYTSDAFIKEIKAVVDSCDIQRNDFKFALTTPYYSTLRERLIEILLEERPDLMNIVRRHYFNVKDEWKRLIIERLEAALGMEYRMTSLFEINLTFNRVDDLGEDLLLLKKFGLNIRAKKKCDPSLKQEFTRQDIVSALSTVKSKQLKEYYDLPLKFLSSKYEISCSHEPIFLAGRYLKFSRRLPQSEWIVEGVKKTETSIEELLADFFQPIMQTKEKFKLVAAGREDVDVKCLGTGRPFVLEIPLPKRTQFTQDEMTQLQHDLNAKTLDLIKVIDLQLIHKDQVKNIKVGENSKSKTYSALCFSYTKVNEDDLAKISCVENLVINQKTPIRVLHRRALLDRTRTIHNITATYIDDHHFNINLTTEAGTYIKEFVHGDYGRTEPSICTILNKDCDILELDVYAVNFDFPPKINTKSVSS